MTSFVFRLQSVLDLRLAERDRRREELARALRAEQLLAQQIGALQRTVQQTRRGMQRAAQPGTVDVAKLLDAQRYELVLNAQIAQLQEQQERIKAETVRRRAALVEAGREVRMLEKLRTRRWEEHQAKAAKIEQRELDEIATRSTFRDRETPVS